MNVAASIEALFPKINSPPNHSKTAIKAVPKNSDTGCAR